MKVVTCLKCKANNRVDETKLATSEAKCGHCGTTLDAATADGTSAGPTVLTDASFQQEVLNASGPPTLVDFWAPWCGPCRVVGPILEEIAAEREDLKVVKLNTDENIQTASEYQILAIPTLLVFRNGQVAKRIQGAMPKKRIEAELEPALA